nr:MAG: hypothetical protein [Bacteriophage sp.]
MKLLKKIKNKIERELDMMIKLYAINVISGNYQYAKIPKLLKPKVKAQIALMVEDDELLEELTKEDVAE